MIERGGPGNIDFLLLGTFITFKNPTVIKWVHNLLPNYTCLNVPQQSQDVISCGCSIHHIKIYASQILLGAKKVIRKMPYMKFLAAKHKTLTTK